MISNSSISSIPVVITDAPRNLSIEHRIIPQKQGRKNSLWTPNDFKGKNGVTYSKRTAICLETQHFPDSCNQPEFPSILLMPGEIFQSKTQFVFTAE